MYTQFNKAITALVLAVVGVINYFDPGLHLNVSPDSVNVALSLLTPILVYVIPNMPKDAS